MILDDVEEKIKRIDTSKEGDKILSAKREVFDYVYDKYKISHFVEKKGSTTIENLATQLCSKYKSDFRRIGNLFKAYDIPCATYEIAYYIAKTYG